MFQPAPVGDDDSMSTYGTRALIQELLVLTATVKKIALDQKPVPAA